MKTAASAMSKATWKLDADAVLNLVRDAGLEGQEGSFGPSEHSLSPAVTRNGHNGLEPVTRKGQAAQRRDRVRTKTGPDERGATDSPLQR